MIGLIISVLLILVGQCYIVLALFEHIPPEKSRRFMAAFLISLCTIVCYGLLSIALYEMWQKEKTPPAQYEQIQEPLYRKL